MLVVLRQEYLLRVKTKAFLFGTFILPLLLAATAAVPGLFMSVSVGQPTDVALVDQTGRLADALQRALDDTTKSGQRVYNLVPGPSGDSREGLARALGGKVEAGEIGGFIILPADLLEGGKASFYAENVSDFQRNERLEGAIDRAVREVRISDTRLDPDQVASILQPVKLETYRVGEGGVAKADQGVTFGLAYIVGFFFYLTLFIYGSMMLRAALEEKTSRTAEVMIATVRASTLMGGKILGIGLVGLTQIALWILIGALFSLYAGTSGFTLMGDELTAARFGVTPSLVFYFVLFFTLGFLLYAGIFSAFGAMVSSDAEAQQVQTPVAFPIIIAFMLMFLAIRDPNGLVVRICSLFPLFAPILMMVRICVLRPPFWEIALSVALLGASIVGSIWVAGRVFRVGLLMYGKRPTLPELIKWIRYG